MKSANESLFLVGATGVGKSAGAMELARSWAGPGGGAAILGMDAMQVYRGADIGTGKATAAERAEVPHGGLDLVDIGESFDVARYLKHAGDFLREQRAAGRRVVIVGGTGLYFRALTRGLCEAPQGSDALRAELNALSAEELRARLGARDPAMLARVDGANPRRLVRAIEVVETTGRSLRLWQEETPAPLVAEFAAYWIQRGKAELSWRIEARVEAMFAQGWIEEVRGLVGRYGMEAVLGFPGIGYGEIAGAMREADQITRLTKLPNSERGGKHGGREADLILRQAQDDGFSEEKREQLKRDIVAATRQYAKRQLTWFAREPNLRAVMLTGAQPFSAVFPALL